MNLTIGRRGIATKSGFIRTSQRFAMPHRCLSCHQRLGSDSATPYAGDFCSEYCFSRFPQPRIRRQQPQWVKGIADSVLETQRILHRNHGILRAFRDQCTRLPAVSDVSGLTWLEQQGFDFDHHTRLITTPRGETEVWCFDEGYRMEADGRVSPL